MKAYNAFGKSDNRGIFSRSNGVTVFAIVLTYLLASINAFDFLDNKISNFFAAKTMMEIESDVVVVEIDAYSLRKINNWPWKRSLHAQLLRTLKESGAEKVFFDIDFSSVSTVDEDKELAAAISSMPSGYVYLPVFWQHQSNQNQKVLILTKPIESLLKNTELASVNLRPDDDGLVRRLLTEKVKVKNYPDMAYKLRGIEQLNEEKLIINYRIDLNSFKYFSYADILQGKTKPDLKNKVVIVGASAIELGDQVPVPVHKSISGPVMQALIYESLDHKNRLKVVNSTFYYVGLFLLAVLLGPIFNKAGWKSGLIIVGFSVVLIYSLSVIVLVKSNLVLPVATYIFLIVVQYLFMQLVKLDVQAIKLLVQRIALSDKEIIIRNIMHASMDGIVTFDQKGNLKTANQGACELLGESAENLYQKSIFKYLPFLKEIVEKDAGEARLRSEEKLQTSNGSMPLEYSLTSAQLEDDLIYTLYLRDISERFNYEQNLVYQATHDFNTGILNQVGLNDYLSSEISEAVDDDFALSLFIIDIHEFKEISNTLGPIQADSIVQHTAERLQESKLFKEGLARFGDDQFAVTVNNRDMVSEDETIKDLQALFERPMPVGQMQLRLTIKIGSASYPQDATTAVDLIQRANIALTNAKENDLDSSKYHDELDKYNIRKLFLQSDLKNAIENKELFLFYQPKLDLHSGRVTGVESLVRWKQPNYGVVQPDAFISVAEKTGLIKPLTLFTIENALYQRHKLLELGIDLSLAVNVSAVLVQDMAFVDDLKSVLKNYDFHRSWLEFEITESAIVSDLNRASEALSRFRDLGIKLSIDDFGTGYASLSYLKKLPVDQVKLDRLFIHELSQSEGDQIIVKSTIELCHALGLAVVAEGIENKQTFDMLKALNCDYIQGYYLSKPISESALITFINEYNGSSAIEG